MAVLKVFSLALIYAGLASAGPHIRPMASYKYVSPRKSNDLDSNLMEKAMHDVQQTISTVQRILNEDPALPRLTKGEIEELFEKVTKEELMKSMRRGDRNRAKHMRALLVVLPYQANHASPEELQQLYTQQPVTKLFDPNRFNLQPSSVRSTFLTPIPNLPSSPQQNFYRNPTVYPSKIETSTKFTLPAKRMTPNFNPQTTEIVPPALTTREREVKEILGAIGLTVPATTTTTTPATTTQVSEEVKEDLRKLLAEFGLLNEQNVQVNDRSDHLKVEARGGDFKPLPDSLNGETLRKLTPTLSPLDYEKFKPIKFASEPVDEGVEDLLKSFGLLDGTSKARRKKMVLVNGLFNNDEIGYTTSTEKPKPTKMEMVEELEGIILPPQMRDVLANIGINAPIVEFLPAPSIQTIQRRSDDQEEKKLDDQDPWVGIDDTSVDSLHSPSAQTARRRSNDQKEKKTHDKDPRLGIDDTSVESLPSPSAQTARRRSNDQKERKTHDQDPRLGIDDTSVESLPSPSAQTARRRSNDQKEKKTHDKDPRHGIDDPSVESLPSPSAQTAKRRSNDQEEKKTAEQDPRLEALLDTIKNFNAENISLTDESIDKLNLKNFNLTDESAPGLDPIANFESFRNAKNEVKKKRQDDDPLKIPLDLGDSTTSSTTTEDPTAEPQTAEPEASNATDEPRNSDFEALQDSFPKDDDPSVIPDESLPKPKPNGFYFLADINHFFEVGEDPEKVIVRQNKMIGDPSHFIPVTIP